MVLVIYVDSDIFMFVNIHEKNFDQKIMLNKVKYLITYMYYKYIFVMRVSFKRNNIFESTCILE